MVSLALVSFSCNQRNTCQMLGRSRQRQHIIRQICLPE